MFKNMVFVSLVCSFFVFASTQAMQDAKVPAFSFKDVAGAAANVGATVGSLGFFAVQKAPRQRFLGLFVGSCAALQGMQLSNNQFVHSVAHFTPTFTPRNFGV
jgi:hypothetical protein